MVTATLTARKVRKPRAPRPKPARSVRVLLPVFGSNPGIIAVTVGGLRRDYWLYPLAADFGRGFRVEGFASQLADEGEERDYQVNVNGRQSSCTCKGFCRWGHCKHLGALSALIERGKL